MSDLLMTRLMLGSPQFYPTGIDYIEPITVTDGRSRQREMKLLHHVSHRRVIHLKLVESLTAKEVPFKVNQFKRSLTRDFELVVM